MTLLFFLFLIKPGIGTGAPSCSKKKKKSGQNIMLGGLKTLKNLGESISDTQITVSWSVWKRTQKNCYFGQKMAIFDIFSCDWIPY